MTYAIKDGASWRELPRNDPIIIDDTATSYASMLAWSPQYRTAQGIKAIEDDELPEGKMRVGEARIEDRDGKPVRVWDLEDAPVYAPLIPNIISDRQFAEILALDGLITEDEALAWAGPGIVPAQLLEAVEMIPDDGVRFSAKMHLVGATQFLRDNAFVAMLGMILQRNAAQLDDIWTRAAAL